MTVQINTGPYNESGVPADQHADYIGADARKDERAAGLVYVSCHRGHKVELIAYYIISVYKQHAIKKYTCTIIVVFTFFE